MNQFFVFIVRFGSFTRLDPVFINGLETSTRHQSVTGVNHFANLLPHQCPAMGKQLEVLRTIGHPTSINSGMWVGLGRCYL